MAKRRINLGCGDVKVSGSINVDIREDADLCCDIRYLPYPDDYIQWAEAHHVLEHFSREEGKRCLQEWHRVLIPGGLLFLTVPDLPTCFEGILNNLDTPGIWQPLMAAVYGVQQNDYDFHKWGYSLPVLLLEMAETGFEAEGFSWPHRPTPTIGVLGKKIKNGNGKESV